jgi:hypothetical protein
MLIPIPTLAVSSLTGSKTRAKRNKSVKPQIKPRGKLEISMLALKQGTVRRKLTILARLWREVTHVFSPNLTAAKMPQPLRVTDTSPDQDY